MAQTQRNFSQLTIPNGGPGAEIISLRTSVVSGEVVRATDINRIATLINNMNGHYHGTTEDAYQLATFGNTGDRTNYYQTNYTNPPDSVNNVGTSTLADSSITATRHNELATAINNIRSHYHAIDDRTS